VHGGEDGLLGVCMSSHGISSQADLVFLPVSITLLLYGLHNTPCEEKMALQAGPLNPD